MKKMFIWGAVALVMLGLAGCPGGGEDGPSSSPDGPKTDGTWTTGINDFEVQTGDNPGEIKYKFTATNPDADSYTLYYAPHVPPATDKASAIIAINKTEIVTPQSSFTALSFNFLPSAPYSMVVVAKKTGVGEAMSHVRHVTAKGNPTAAQLELTVSGITGATILAATLFDDTLLTTQPPQQPVPKAVGMNINGTFKFFEYNPNSPTYMGSAWTQTGQYHILLATTITGAGANYIYTGGGQNPVKYNFTSATATIAWSQFTLNSGGGGGPTDGSFALTVTGLPSDILMALVVNASTPIASAVFDNGVFTFYEPMSADMPLPNPNKPWNVPGSYTVILTGMEEDAPTYMGQVTFSGNSGTVNFNTFNKMP